MTILYLGQGTCGVHATHLKWHDWKFIQECYSLFDVVSPFTDLAPQTCPNNNSTKRGWLYRRKYSRLDARALSSSSASALNPFSTQSFFVSVVAYHKKIMEDFGILMFISLV